MHRSLGLLYACGIGGAHSAATDAINAATFGSCAAAAARAACAAAATLPPTLLWCGLLASARRRALKGPFPHCCVIRKNKKGGTRDPNSISPHFGTWEPLISRLG